MKAAQHIDQIVALISSPMVDKYVVGITCNFKSRRSAYKKEKFPYFFVIEVALDKVSAVKLEEDLFNLLVSDKRSIAYKKYHHDKRDGRYHRSTGGKDSDSYFVYIAAFAP